MIISISNAAAMFNFKNKKVLIFGLGRLGGGLAVTKWLAKQGAKISVVDSLSRQQLKTSIDKLKNYRIRYFLNQQPDKNFLDYDYIIKNPAVPKQHQFLQLARKRKMSVFNEASLFFSLVNNPIIAITGTKGKSTTTDLLGRIFQTWNQDTLAGGNSQTNPMFAIISKIKPQTVIILELSSWHLEGLKLIKKSPSIAVITNILPDHLNRYQSFNDYAQTKKIILDYQQSDDFAVLNFDNPICRSFARRTKTQVIWFGTEDYKKYRQLTGAFVKNDWLVWQQKKVEQIIKLKSIKIPGQHNLANILAAICVAKLKAIPNSVINRVIISYRGLANRLQLIKTVEGVDYYNDTTATAPVATLAALQTFSRPVILLAGGSDKKLPLVELARVIKTSTKYCLLFTGDGSDRLIRELTKINYPQQRLYKNIGSMSVMVKQARKLAVSGDVVLLSPGFASFSNFANEFARGDQFIKVLFDYDKKK